MVALVKSSFEKAHRTIASNLVLFWFPPLFGTAMVVLLLLLAIILLQVMPAQEVPATPIEMLPMAGTMIVLALATVVVLVATNSGTMYLQGKAARGETVDTGHFVLGVRLLFTKVLAGSIFVYLWYALIIVGFGWTLFEDFGRLMSTGVLLSELPTAEVEIMLMKHSSRLAVGGAVALLSAVVLSMWTRVLALGDSSLGQAMVRGGRFALMNIVIIGGVFLLHWGATFALQQYLSNVFWLGVVMLTHAMSVYVSVALMHFYLTKTGPETY